MDYAKMSEQKLREILLQAMCCLLVRDPDAEAEILALLNDAKTELELMPAGPMSGLERYH